MTKDALEKRVAELERRVKELEAQPREQHFHYHPPVYVPTVTPQEKSEPYRIYIGDPPYWPNTTATVTWDGKSGLFQ